MRLRFVIQQLGLLLVILSVAMLPAAGWSVHDYFRLRLPAEEDALVALLLSALAGTAVGLVLYRRGRAGEKQLGRKEALLIVALAWVVGAALSAMPFRLWAAFHDFSDGADPAFRQYVNCYFEAMSGLTTTGASTLTDIETIPRSLLFWRAFIQWLGGLGIVVLFVAVLPILGVGGKRLFRFEAPGPKKEGVRPRIRAATQVLWLIYLGITVAEILALKLAGIGWFDSMSHAFTTLATGGFSTKSASITGLASWKVELIIVWFMFMAGVNFGLYDQLISGRWRAVLKNPELRAYVTLILVATLVIAAMRLGHTTTTVAGAEETGVGATLRHCLFSVVSLQTATGFCTADFDQWSFPAKAILVALMFVGGCAGSTSGGIKVIRFVVLAKVLRAELEAVFRPTVVRTIRVGQSTVDPQMRSAILVYFLLVGIIAVVATGLVIWLETPDKLETAESDAFETAFTTFAATFNNVGPGLDLVGPTRNYDFFTGPTKILLCLVMALGRLELYAFLVLVMPAFWREE